MFFAFLSNWKETGIKLLIAAIQKIKSSFWCKTFVLACFVQGTFYIILAYFFLFPDPLQTYHRGWQLVNDEFDGSDRKHWHQMWKGFENIYDKRIKTEADAIFCLKEALASLNEPHTMLMNFANPGETLDAIYCDMTSQFHGCGMELVGPETSEPLRRYVAFPKLRTILAGSPAEKGGLQCGDELLGVDGKSTFRQPVELLWSRIHGSGTGSVSLEVRRGGKVSFIKLERGLFQYPSVKSTTLPGKIGYIRLSNFRQWDCSDQVENALLDLKDSRALILDLRDNPGGSLRNAIEICALFMESGTICYENERVNDCKSNKYDRSEVKLLPANSATISSRISNASAETLKKPLVILINENSASAAEMVAAALKETRDSQAVFSGSTAYVELVGKTSYGKGVGQTANVVSGTVLLSIRSLHWTTPNDHWLGDAHIDRRGLKPDIEVSMNKGGTELGSSADNQLESAREFLCNNLGSTNGK